MNDMRDYLARKAAELGLERGDQLREIQAYLDDKYPGQCRAVSLNDGILKITTPNASVASELRFSAQQIVEKFNAQRAVIKISG